MTDPRSHTDRRGGCSAVALRALCIQCQTGVRPLLLDSGVSPGLRARKTSLFHMASADSGADAPVEVCRRFAAFSFFLFRFPGAHAPGYSLSRLRRLVDRYRLSLGLTPRARVCRAFGSWNTVRRGIGLQDGRNPIAWFQISAYPSRQKTKPRSGDIFIAWGVSPKKTTHQLV
jgi:hypothetical protein